MELINFMPLSLPSNSMDDETTKSSSSSFSISDDQPQLTLSLLPSSSSSSTAVTYDTPTLLLFPIRPQNPNPNSELKSPILDHEKTSPVSLDLSLSSNHSQRMKLPLITNKKRKEIPLSWDLSLSMNHNQANKRMKLPLITNKSNSQADSSLWTIKKFLTISDLGHLSRLIVASEDAQEHIIKVWDPKGVNNHIIQERLRNGVKVRVWDCDTKTEHEMVLRRWESNGSFLFNYNWIKGFVKRRELKKGDQIGLFWDKGNSRFNFSLLNPA